MRHYISLKYFSLLFVTSLVSCTDWLREESPGVTKLEDFFTGGETALQSVTASYVPLAWEYNNTYFSEWFIGDVVSDDALKGGQSVTDMGAVYDMENFKANNNNSFLLDYYRAQYQGIARCNLVLQEVPKVGVDEFMDTELKDRILGEAKFLRAFYYFRLARVFGGVPKVDFVVDSSNDWIQPRASVEEIYDFVIEDLLDAESKLWNKSEYSDNDLGRATKGAAQAMLLKAYLQIQDFEKAETWGAKLFEQNNQEYRLCDNYADNFTLAGENGPESVFEIQYTEEGTSDYGEGYGFTRGTFTVILTRSRSSELGGGWGFNKPTPNLYAEYETNDPRRDMTILNPTDDQIENPAEEIYLGSRYLNRKYAMMEDGENNTLYALTHETRGPINNKVIRYADVLLMYAEACCENGNLTRAKEALEIVRNRARHGDTTILPAFPNYNSYSDTQADLKNAIRHERRVELAMEGHRWFDLCRWGVAKEVIDAYKAAAPQEVKQEMSEFVKGVHELFPIPGDEINLGGLTQNPGY